MPQPVRIALIGAGIFARDAHLPALETLGDQFELVAVFSRSADSAKALVEHLPHVEIFTNLPALLARPDIEAVDILLPIEIMPSAIELALNAGKHVISEKPLAPDVSTGRRLLAVYAERRDQVWMVAENWRYEEAFRRAGELIAEGAIGRPIVFHYPVYTQMNAENKYFHTGWRRSGEVPGGFLLDGGIHHIAAIRMVLGDIAQISASVSQVSPDLPPADTVSAALELESGLTGGYVATYASGAPWETALSVLGEKGALRVDRSFLEVADDSGTRREPLEQSHAVRAELADFAAAIRTGSQHRNSPEEAFADLATVEAMLQSAATGHRTAPERYHD